MYVIKVSIPMESGQRSSATFSFNLQDFKIVSVLFIVVTIPCVLVQCH